MIDLDNLPPGALQQLLNMGVIDDQQAMIQQQLKQAQMLRAPSGAQHTTGIGAALGGGADAINNIGGAIQSKLLRGKQQGLIDERRKGLGAFADAYSAAGAPAAGPAPAPGGFDPLAAAPGGAAPDPFALGLRPKARAPYSLGSEQDPAAQPFALNIGF